MGGEYLVYYNPVENTVFCDWERLVEEVEQPIPTQPPEETHQGSRQCRYNARYIEDF
jgi:hypothetical protein